MQKMNTLEEDERDFWFFFLAFHCSVSSERIIICLGRSRESKGVGVATEEGKERLFMNEQCFIIIAIDLPMAGNHLGDFFSSTLSDDAHFLFFRRARPPIVELSWLRDGSSVR